MAITYDSSSIAASVSNTSPLVFSHTTGTIDNGIIVVGCSASNADCVTGVTYNGNALTQVAKQTNPDFSNRRSYIYIGYSPASGAHDVSISWTGTSRQGFGAATTYSGVGQIGQPDSYSGNFNDSNNKTLTLTTTTVADNSRIVGYIKNSQAGTLTTSRGTIRQSSGSGCIFDSNAAITPAGATSTTITSTANAYWVGSVISLSPTAEVFGTAPTLQRTRYRDALGAVGQTFALGATYGYFAGGGNTAGTIVATADMITYSTGAAAANTGSNLSAARRYLAGISDKVTYGYFAGGGNTAGAMVATTDMVTFSTSTTAANTVSNLSGTKSYLTGLSSGTTYGYFSGGFNSGFSYLKVTDRITFSSGVTAANTASDLSVGRYGLAGVSDGLTYGYFMGGNTGARVATTDRITFSTSATAANTASNCSQVKEGPSGLSDGSTYGYVSGGNSGALSVGTDRVTFSTSATAANTTSNLSVAKNRHCSGSDGYAYGYFAGGDTGAIVATTDRITFSTGTTAANTVSNLSVARSSLAGLSDLAI